MFRPIHAILRENNLYIPEETEAFTLIVIVTLYYDQIFTEIKKFPNTVNSASTRVSLTRIGKNARGD
jgi:hypothetical protein